MNDKKIGMDVGDGKSSIFLQSMGLTFEPPTITEYDNLMWLVEQL